MQRYTATNCVRKKILLADDSSVIQNLTKKILQFNNFDVELANDGNEVIDLLKKSFFDLILLDMEMPHKDGFQCIKAIRSFENQQKATTPTFACTGNARNLSIETYKNLGFNDLIEKPIDFDLLLNKIRCILG